MRRGYALALLAGLGGCYDPTIPPGEDLPDGGTPAFTCGEVRDLDVGATTVCAITAADGTIACWGDSDWAQQGQGFSFYYSPEPHLVLEAINHVPLSGVQDVAVGKLFACAIDAEGAVWCWGDNAENEIGQATPGSIEPVATAVIGLPASAAELAAGDQHVCARLRDGTVWCWGDDSLGKLGNGDLNATAGPPVQVMGLTGIAEIDAGGDHTCARSGTGVISCWGNGYAGQIGTVTESAMPRAQLPLASPAVALGTGYDHTCAVTLDGDAWCWGLGTSGQLGDGMGENSMVPVQVLDAEGQPLRDVVAIDGGDQHTCFVLSGGELSCTGSDLDGQMGTGEQRIYLRAVPITLPLSMGTARQVASHTRTTCVRGHEGVACIGANEHGQAGAYPGVEPVRPPSLVATCPRPTCLGDACPSGCVTALRLGGEHACAILSDGGVWCWGDPNRGLGTGADVTDPAPLPLPVLRGQAPLIATDVGPTYANACFVAEGAVVCAGDNSYGQTGLTVAGPLDYPDVGPLLGGAKVVAVGRGNADHQCALTDGGVLWCWGRNDFGQVGDLFIGGSIPPKSLLGDVRSFTLGGWSTCVTDSVGHAFCWGQGTGGQLGDGELANSVEPVPVGGAVLLEGIEDVSCGDYHCCARLANGTRCWGQNSSGQLGTGNTVYQGTPVEVMLTVTTPLGAVDEVVAGGAHTCARLGGELLCWGLNTRGQLGIVGDDSASFATVVTVPVGIDDVEVGAFFTCVVGEAGRGVYCSGLNSDGELGRPPSVVPERRGFEPVALPCPGL